MYRRLGADALARRAQRQALRRRAVEQKRHGVTGAAVDDLYRLDGEMCVCVRVNTGKIDREINTYLFI